MTTQLIQWGIIMNIKINSIDDLRVYLSTFLTPEETRYTIAIVEDEFLRGIDWVKTVRHPMGMVRKMIDEGDGIYNKTVDNIQYRVTIKNSNPTVMVAHRKKDGVAICPGWFGRIKKNMAFHGWRPNERKSDKLFIGLNQYIRWLKAQ